MKLFSELPAGKGRKETRTPDQERLAMLGIPENELTPAVTVAVSALLEKMDDMSREIVRTRDHLSEIEQLVDVDCLVPMPNRRALMRRLNWAIAMHDRYRHPAVVAFLDMDRLKTINDSLGHAAGDAAIRHMAKFLAESLRDSDFVARLGGDEFAAILYHAGEQDAEIRLSQIRIRLHQSPLLWNGRRLEVDFSFGLYAVQKGVTAEEAISLADTAMYLDKQRRNRARLTDMSA